VEGINHIDRLEERHYQPFYSGLFNFMNRSLKKEKQVYDIANYNEIYIY
jgi:hypothetical protein